MSNWFIPALAIIVVVCNNLPVISASSITYLPDLPAVNITLVLSNVGFGVTCGIVCNWFNLLLILLLFPAAAIPALTDTLNFAGVELPHVLLAVQVILPGPVPQLTVILESPCPETIV